MVVPLRTLVAVVTASLGLAAPLCGADLAAPQKRVALVFDDGPVPKDAEPLLALLAREHVRVTFSFVGDRVSEHPDMARTVALAGHEVANHSETHSHPNSLSDSALQHEVADAQAKITAATGRAPRWYWPPFLEVDARLKAAVEKEGLSLYTPRHLVVSKDYDRTVPAEAIRKNALTGVDDGTVILFHEWREETRAELPAILSELRREGCVFLTFSDLYDSLATSDKTPK